MQKINVKEIIKSYEMDALNKPKNKATNDKIIEMLLNTTLESISVNHTKSLAVCNRGEVVECVLKNQVFDYLGKNKEIATSKSYTNDLDLRQIKDIKSLNDLGLYNSTYEIKFISPLANATVKKNKTKKVLIVNAVEKFGCGVYLVDSKNLVVNDSKHIKAESVVNGVRLDLLSELLGLA